MWAAERRYGVTEPDWLTTLEARQMLQFVENSLTGRKSRLLACVCCETYRRHFRDQELQSAIEVACLTAESAGVSREREAAVERIDAIDFRNSPWDDERVAAI